MTLAQRNARAQRLGWRSYGERRYWSCGLCGGRREPTRRRLMFCGACDRLVNPPGPREGTWEERWAAARSARRSP